jgi:hypothetical protein
VAVALGGGGVEPLAMAVGRRWLAVLERRAIDQRGGGGRAPGEAAPGDGPGKEVAPAVGFTRRRHQRLGA